jgi:hypothetical protein
MTAGQLVDLWGARYEATTALELGDSAVGDVLGDLARRGVSVTRARRPDASLGPCDVVVSHAPPHADEATWAAELRAAAALATKILVVFAPNPRRLLGHGVATTEIAPVLWELGRVREHLFLDAPPALETALDMAPEKLRERLARSHAFVVDRTPRTPQERRRRLKQVA